MKALDFTYGSKDIQDIISLYQQGRLNLEPGFQRKSVWSVNDRKKLITSIIQNYPIPSIFLYRTTDSNGRLKYDVLDGKQRLESILMFLGNIRSNKFEIKFQLRDDDDPKIWDWNKLKKAKQEHRITGYRIQTIEVSGELSDIIDLFVRINSTGKSLSSQEKRHAKFYHSNFLRTAGSLGNKYQNFFVENRVINSGQATRMKYIELICELLASIHSQQLLNKKTALDKVIGGENLTIKSLEKCKIEFTRVLNILKKMFPNLKETRFAYSAEFYSLFMLIWEYDKNKLILGDRTRNKQAQNLLVWMSNGVDELRTQMSKAKGARPDQHLFASYLFTTRGDSDSSTTRKRRYEVLIQLFGGLFERKDDKRGFTKEQRRLIWNTDSLQSCVSCGTKLTWENFTIDHIKSHALGGKSSLANAALMCQTCNSRKGKRQLKNRT